MLHPNQFQVNEAWIAFKLNDIPIPTDRDDIGETKTGFKESFGRGGVQ